MHTTNTSQLNDLETERAEKNKKAIPIATQLRPRVPLVSRLRASVPSATPAIIVGWNALNALGRAASGILLKGLCRSINRRRIEPACLARSWRPNTPNPTPSAPNGQWLGTDVWRVSEAERPRPCAAPCPGRVRSWPWLASWRRRVEWSPTTTAAFDSGVAMACAWRSERSRERGGAGPLESGACVAASLSPFSLSLPPLA